MALAAGRPVDAPAGGIAADSLAPKRVGEMMFPIAQAHVERVVLVSDEAIQAAQQSLWDIAAGRGGARRRGRLRRLAERRLPSATRRARRSPGLRGQHLSG